MAHFPDPKPKSVCAAHGRPSSTGSRQVPAFLKYTQWPAELFQPLILPFSGFLLLLLITSQKQLCAFWIAIKTTG